jgi:hypothetical protein
MFSNKKSNIKYKNKKSEKRKEVEKKGRLKMNDEKKRSR